MPVGVIFCECVSYRYSGVICFWCDECWQELEHEEGHVCFEMPVIRVSHCTQLTETVFSVEFLRRYRTIENLQAPSCRKMDY